jgi:hypothetical protein
MSILTPCRLSGEWGACRDGAVFALFAAAASPDPGGRRVPRP